MASKADKKNNPDPLDAVNLLPVYYVHKGPASESQTTFPGYLSRSNVQLGCYCVAHPHRNISADMTAMGERAVKARVYMETNPATCNHPFTRPSTIYAGHFGMYNDEQIGKYEDERHYGRSGMAHKHPAVCICVSSKTRTQEAKRSILPD